MPDIELEIDELVLHGFPAADRAQIGDAVHAELHRLLSGLRDTDALRSLGRRGSLDAGSFDIGGDSSSRAIGAQIANRIVGSATGGVK